MAQSVAVRRYTLTVAILVVGFSLFYLFLPVGFGPAIKRPGVRPLLDEAPTGEARPDDEGDE